MIFEALNDEEEYKRLHGLVFHTTPDAVPPVVTVGRNNRRDIVGFISGFWTSDDSFYIKWAGVLPEYQKGAYLRNFKSLLDPEITYDLAVKNTNTVTLKLVLSLGFIPMGTIYENDNLFVQLKRVKNGN